MTRNLIAIFAVVAFLTPGSAADLAWEAKEIIRNNCGECHLGDEPAADLQLFNHASLVDLNYLTPGNTEESPIYKVVTSVGRDVMPPTRRRRPLPADIAKLRTWIESGAAAYPDDVSIDAGQPSVEEAILTHISAAAEEDRPFLRYFSLRHHVHSGITAERLDVQRVALAIAINHVSRGKKRVNPEPIDAVGEGSVMVVDIRKLAWDREVPNPIDDSQTINVFDRLLLEYPYGIVPSDQALSEKLTAHFVDVAKQPLPIPYLRGDWFCSIALQAPHYQELLELPATIAQLETELKVDVKQNVEKGKTFRAGMAVSAVSGKGRVVERHKVGRSGYYWKSSDFDDSIGPHGFLQNPLEFTANGGQAIFSLRNGVHAYFAFDENGNRIDELSNSIAVDPWASDRVARNGLSCIRCHHAGLKDVHDVVTDVVGSFEGEVLFDKEQVLAIYGKNDVMMDELNEDRTAYVKTIKRLGTNPWYANPIADVTSEFLDSPVTPREAAGELGVEVTQLQTAITSAGPAGLPLAPLATGSIMDRQVWQNNFGTAVELLKLGTPLSP